MINEQNSNPLATAEVVTMPKDEALKAYNIYAQAVRRSRSAADRAIASAYKALSEGKGIINIAAAIKKAGIDNATSLPLLAIVRADEKLCYFRRVGVSTAGLYGATQQLAQRRNRNMQNARRQFEAPEGTFPSWHDMNPGKSSPRGFWDVHRAPVPPIPPAYRPADAYSKYMILWHVEKWEMVAPVDPMLLRPLTGGVGLAVVVAHWDLTPIERMVMGGLLGQ